MSHSSGTEIAGAAVIFVRCPPGATKRFAVEFGGNTYSVDPASIYAFPEGGGPKARDNVLGYVRHGQFYVSKIA